MSPVQQRELMATAQTLGTINSIMETGDFQESDRLLDNSLTNTKYGAYAMNPVHLLHFAIHKVRLCTTTSLMAGTRKPLVEG
jgi:hypothetical protein